MHYGQQTDRFKQIRYFVVRIGAQQYNEPAIRFFRAEFPKLRYHAEPLAGDVGACAEIEQKTCLTVILQFPDLRHHFTRGITDKDPVVRAEDGVSITLFNKNANGASPSR